MMDLLKEMSVIILAACVSSAVGLFGWLVKVGMAKLGDSIGSLSSHIKEDGIETRKQLERMVDSNNQMREEAIRLMGVVNGVSRRD